MNIYPLGFRGNCSATSNNMKLVHWPLIGGLLHLVQRGGAWTGWGPAQSPPRFTNVTAHPSTTSIPVMYCCIRVRCSAILMCPSKVKERALCIFSFFSVACRGIGAHEARLRQRHTGRTACRSAWQAAVDAECSCATNLPTSEVWSRFHRCSRNCIGCECLSVSPGWSLAYQCQHNTAPRYLTTLPHNWLLASPFCLLMFLWSEEKSSDFF